VHGETLERMPSEYACQFAISNFEFNSSLLQ